MGPHLINMQKDYSGVQWILIDTSMEQLELARGIEPPTCGLQISAQGVAQVVDDMGNPLAITGESHIQLFASTRLFLSLIQSVWRYS